MAIDHQALDEGDGCEECSRSAEVIQLADEDLHDATRSCSVLMADEEPAVRADGPIGKQSKDGGSEPPESSRCLSIKVQNEGIWKAVMRLEVEGLVNNDSFIASKLPSGRRPVAAWWMYA